MTWIKNEAVWAVKIKKVKMKKSLKWNYAHSKNNRWVGMGYDNNRKPAAIYKLEMAQASGKLTATQIIEVKATLAKLMDNFSNEAGDVCVEAV